VGVGWVEGERFRFRQYFMRDYHEEPALLRGLAEDLAGCERIVTFNGGLFDVPLLETRYRLNRERFPLGQALHFDLLHPARRLWKARLESCRLQSLERALLGVTRRGDVPGEEIPRIYFDFVRRRDGRAMARVLEHNRLDVLSLAALAALACQWVEGGHAEDPATSTVSAVCWSAPPSTSARRSNTGGCSPRPRVPCGRPPSCACRACEEGGSDGDGGRVLGRGGPERGLAGPARAGPAPRAPQP
jgi:hypothetical protein